MGFTEENLCFQAVKYGLADVEGAIWLFSVPKSGKVLSGKIKFALGGKKRGR